MARGDSKPSSGPGGSTSRVPGNGMTVKECETMIQRSLRTPMVKFLKEHMEKSGCSVGSNFIKAVNCKSRTAGGGYVTGQGIMVCSNNLRIQDEVTQVVIHELIHAYDECRAANLDWRNCAHHACSELMGTDSSWSSQWRLSFQKGVTSWFHEAKRSGTRLCEAKSNEISNRKPILFRSRSEGCHGSCLGCLL